ncbi:MAG TPA: hypothetical protein VF485_07400 [Sphingomonas sp.]
MAALLAAGAAIGGAVNHGHRFLNDSLRPAVLDRAVWCWQDAAARARISASESRRDEMVVRTAILGAERSSPKHDDPGSFGGIIDPIRRIDRDADRLGYIYSLFWSPADRRRLFDHVAASRPICSASFGPFTRSAG